MRRWKNSEILEAILTGLEQGRSFEWAPELSDNIISDVDDRGKSPILRLALANEQEFDITCKRVSGPEASEKVEPEKKLVKRIEPWPERKEELVKRTVLVRSDHLAQIASTLTGYGEILGMDHEGTISYSIEGEDAFELGRLAGEIQSELRAYDAGVEIMSATKKMK